MADVGEIVEWNGDVSKDGRFVVQTSHVRGEGVCYTLNILSRRLEDVRREHHVETAWWGRGGKAKVRAAAQTILDLSHSGSDVAGEAK